MKHPLPAVRVGAGILGSTLLLSIAGAGIAAALDDPYGDSDVDVDVEIADINQPGVLAMTVAGSSVTLTEDGSDALTRKFVGILPTVTVTDTRDASEIPAGAAWYVLGSISDFTGDDGQPDILSADTFGWTPHITDGDPGSVTEEMPIAPGEGFTDEEILAVAWDSAGIALEGSWSANADLALHTDANVAPGNYAATLTLSLFE